MTLLSFSHKWVPCEHVKNPGTQKPRPQMCGLAPRWLYCDVKSSSQLHVLELFNCVF